MLVSPSDTDSIGAIVIADAQSLRNIVEGIKSQAIPLEVLETCFEFHSDPDKPRGDAAFNLSCYSMESIPTLQYIKSSIKPIPKAIETYYWNVSKTDGKPMLHQVSQDDRNAVHTIERMFMPSEVHVSIFYPHPPVR